MSKRQGIAAAAERLTETQRQCLRLAYRHLTSKEIAPLLGLSPHSVDAHIRISMKVLGVNSRREAALMLNAIEAEQSARRKPATMDYKATDASRYAHVGEEHTPAWTYHYDRSDMAVSQEHSKKKSATSSCVEQFGSAGAFFGLVSQGETYRTGSWLNPRTHTVKHKIVVILLAALLSALSFSAIASGLAAVSVLLRD